MFAMAACQEELQQPVEEQKPVLEGIEGELQEVTFSVNLEDKAQTKAISDGLSATNLQYAVYRSEEYVASDGTKYPAGKYIPALSQGDDPDAEFSNAKIEKSGDRTWKVTLTLAKNVKYDIVFWAYADNAPYTFKEDAAQITVDDNYTGLANAENRDAFYGLCKGYSVISSEERVELRRPFAQINFGACDYIPYVTDLGLEVTSTIDTQAHEKVEAVYEYDDPINGRLLYAERPAVAECKVPNTLNVLDGTVSGEAVVKFQLADIPYNSGDEDDKVLLSAKTADGEPIPYHWMGMNYILAGAEATINNIHATFHYNGQDLVFDVPNVPYKRNYKTNIIGNLFTENAKFNVVVLPDYFTPDIVIDLDELEALNPIERAIKLAVDGKLTEASVVLSADLELEETITVPAGLNLVLDLGGKTLTSSVAPAFLANGNVTMSNGNAQVAGEFVRAGAGAQITLTGVKAVSGTEKVPGDNCVFVPKDAIGAKVVVGVGTELKSYGAAAIQSNGNTQGLVLTVAGKVESVGVVAMYLPQVATCTIEDGAVISGATGIELRAGDLVVKDGAKISADDDFETKANGNGSTVLGAAVAVSAHSTNLPINVTIEGGEFSCAFALYEVNFFEDRTAATTLAVKAGTFNAPIYSENCTGFITGGTFAEGVEVAYLAEGLIVGEDGVVTEKPEPAIELEMVTTEDVPADGGKVVVKVTANVQWTLALDGEDVKTGAATNETEVEVTVAANELEEVVEHTLTLSAEGVEAKTVKFNQAAAAPAGPTVVTVAEFLAAEDNAEIEYQVSGMITKIYSAYSSQYNNIAFYLKDNTGEMIVYRMSCEGIEKPEAIAPGDQITVKGTRSLYNGVAQMAQGCVCVEYTPFVAQASEWGIVGDFTEWGKNADVVMYNTWHTENLYVAYNVEIASGAFKIRANNKWDDNKNYGLEVAGSIYADKYYAVKSAGDSKDATLMAYGTYDVYFDLANKRVALMTPGKAYAEAVDGGQPIVVVAGLKDHAWGVAGSFQGWDAPTAVEAVVEGDWAVVKNVTLAANDEFKFVADKAWTLSYGSACDVNVGETYTSYSGGNNMKFVGEPGAYNLYFSLIDAKFHMEEYVEAPAETTAKVVMKDLGYANAAKVTEVKIDDNVTLTFAKGKSTSDPAYYTTGEAVRLYQNGATLTVNANGKTIKSIKITFAENQYYIAADSGEFTAEGAERTWTGAAESVKFTTTGTDKNHRAYVSAVEVTYE